MQTSEQGLAYHKNPLMTQSIDLLELSTRTRNILLTSKMKFMGHVVLCSDAQLLKLPNMTVKSAAEINTSLALRDLKTGLVSHPFSNPQDFHKINLFDFYELDVDANCINNPVLLESVYGHKKNESNPKFPLSIRTMNALRAENILYVAQLITFSEKDLLEMPQLGKKSVREIKKLLSEHGLRLGTYCPQNLTTPEGIRKTYSIDKEGSSSGANLANPQSIHKIFLDVCLPSSLVEGQTDDEVISSIRATCQAAFDRAVFNIGGEEVALSSKNVSPPQGGIRSITVPLECDKRLVTAFGKTHLEHAANSISGVRLYPQLKAHLENLGAKPA